MQMMYELISRELKSANLEDAHPTDYLNFYCLGNREEYEKESSSSSHSSSSGSVGIHISHFISISK